ncbi:hypothetical protein [Isoptericola cucumis]|uniref:BrnT family toxin n=1 Tax=Isoptericola cucumis TaxID=1776856 RepID=A0ABQ2B5Y2_9MICO|nr:hypothetical protein [Isoptericola cucumis]GGI06038.1 hypothetical protein GCM10007368_09150 [Isoptericola cucumis]
MFETADWSQRADHMWDGHGVRPAEADEALGDPNRVVIDPDYNSRSGEGVRIIGFCASRGEVLTVLVHKPTGYGINGWRSNAKDRRIYREEGTP